MIVGPVSNLPCDFALRRPAIDEHRILAVFDNAPRERGKVLCRPLLGGPISTARVENNDAISRKYLEAVGLPIS